MTDAVEAAARYAARRFGSARAEPKITQFYTTDGWQPMTEGPTRLSVGAAQELRSRGIFMVRVRHRLRTFEVKLLHYLGFND